MTTLGIVEDQMALFNELMPELKKRFSQIREFSTPDCVNDKDKEEIDFWIVDKRFPGGPLGLSFLSSLKRLVNKRVVFFSRYLTIDEDVGNVEKINSSIFLNIAKPESVTSSTKALRELIFKFFFSDDLPKVMKLDENYLKNEVDAFYSLSKKEQIGVLRQVKNDHSDFIGQKFKNGAIWVAVFGKEGDDHFVANDVSEIPDQAKLSEMEHSKGLPAFVFSRARAFNSTPVCSGGDKAGDSIQTYPLARTVFSTKNGTSDLKIHFDTGADITLLEDSLVESIPDHMPLANPSFEWIQSKGHLVTLVEVPALLECKHESGEGVEAVRMRAFSVEGWSESDLAAQCGKECSLGEYKSVCVHRANGLLGRNIYVENKLDVLINRTSRRVLFFRGD